MKTIRNILPILFSVGIFGVLVIGCKGKKSPDPDHSNLPEDVKPVALAILADSAESFAASVNYPLQRPYPIKDIKDSTEMVKYYPTLIDKEFKEKVHQSPDSLWEQVGWRGWTLGNGEYLWIDGGKIYVMDYVSKREQEMLDSLRKEEIATLDPSMRKGWTPVMCVIDTLNGDIFRIDIDSVNESPVYRLSGYRASANLSGRPSLMLYGNLETEGTMSVRFYHFSDSIGNDANYSPDAIEDDSIPSIEMSKKGKAKRIPVRPTYWLDHIKEDSLRKAYRELKNMDQHTVIKIQGLNPPPQSSDSASPTKTAPATKPTKSDSLEN
ncbi:MAG: hypothetical protein K1W02_14960 [Muribaculaceae bacterium]